MKSDRNKRGDSILVVAVGVVLDAISKDKPQIQPDVASIFVLALANASTHVSQIDRLGYDTAVGFGNL